MKYNNKNKRNSPVFGERHPDNLTKGMGFSKKQLQERKEMMKKRSEKKKNNNT